MKKLAVWLLLWSLVFGLFAGCGDTTAVASTLADDPIESEISVVPASPAESAMDAPLLEASSQEEEETSFSAETEAATLHYPVDISLPLTDDPATLTFWYSGFPNFDFDVVFGANPAIALAEEMTGVHAELTIVTMDSYSEKFNLMIATGEYPDMISTGDYVGGYAQAVNDEVIIDITELVETEALNYMALISQTEVTQKSAYSDDSKIYGFANITKEAALPGSGPIIRQDWLDKLGLNSPETYDDYEEMLSLFQSELSATEPFVMNGTGVDGIMLAGFDTSDGFYVKDGVVTAGYNADEMLAYVTMIHQWYEKGFIGQSFTANPSGQPEESTILSDNAGCWTSGYQLTDYEEKAANPDYSLRGAPFPVQNHGDKVHTSYLPNVIDCNVFFSVTSCCNDPELAVKWMDFWYSEPGYYLANYGVEGLTYELVDGEPVMTELMTNNPDGLDVRAAIMYYTVQLNTPYYKNTSNLNSAYVSYELEARELWASNQDGSYVIPSAVAFNTEEAEAYGLHYTDIETYADENILKFIVGDRSLDEWDAYIESFESLGLQSCIDAYQSAYDRFISR